MPYIGDFLAGAAVPFAFTTHDKSGGVVAPSSAFEAADLDWYQDNVAFSPAGVVMTSPLVSTGLHGVVVDTSDEGGDNWTTGSDYIAVLTPDETVDSETVIRIVVHFSIENRAPGDGTILTEAGGDGDHLDEAGGTGDQLTAITDDTGQIGALGIGLTEAGGDGDHLNAINLPNQTMDIIGSLTGNLIGDVTGKVDGTVAGKTPAEAGDLMGLANDAITNAKYDESTAFPLAAVDDAATQIARVGADGDTLETLSDQIDSTLTLTKVIEGTITIQQVLSVGLAVLSGRSSGGGLVFQNEAHDTARVTITADGSGNRTDSVLDFSDL